MVPKVLYQAYQAQRDLTAPATSLAALASRGLTWLPPALTETVPARWYAATSEMVGRARLTHSRPSFSISAVTIDGDTVPVREEVVDATPFGSLVHFGKEGFDGQPKVLIVAALAGHFSTLLRSTAQALLPEFDVYMTDWHNARDIPLDEGSFDFDSYVDHVMRFARKVGPAAHVFAVCQPCPATLAATALLAEDRDPATPRTLTLMAGPVDCRINPTVVNRLATRRPLSWFERSVITTVPFRYPGAGRRVYPGFLQLSAFVSLNWRRHLDRQVEPVRGSHRWPRRPGLNDKGLLRRVLRGPGYPGRVLPADRRRRLSALSPGPRSAGMAGEARGPRRHPTDRPADGGRRA